MFEILKQLIMAKELKFSEGEIKLFGQNLFFIPSETIVDVIHNNSDEQNCYLYNISKRIGYSWFKTMINTHGVSSREIVKWGLQTLTLSGWGKMSLKELEESNSFSRTIMNDSVVGKNYLIKYGAPTIPVDHIVRGLMAGGGCIIHQDPTVEMVEIKCLSKGDPYCEIVARKRLVLSDMSEYKKQIGSVNYDVNILTGDLVKVNEL